ncbi:MAG TPA: DUF2784 domain-containing protein [Vicinamibacterales bacterium]|nr:DUF2784 domain-containing protein [Vicinamibacterales bacterium]
MPYDFLADVVLVVHLGFVLFVVLGGLLALRWRMAPLVHLPALAWGAYIEISGGICPLTPLENRLREAAGGTGYDEGFIEHYLVPILYPSALSRDSQFTLAGLLVVLNLVIYVTVWRRRVARRRGRAPGDRG